MTFFDDASFTAAPIGVSYRRPQWMGPPEYVAPATVGLDVVLGSNDDVAVWIAEASIVPTGVTFGVNIQRRDAALASTPALLGWRTSDAPRLGVQLADGQKLLAEGGQRERVASAPFRSSGLRPCGSMLRGARQRVDLWLWPLPPDGDLTFVFDWRAEEIAQTSTVLDASSIVAAASRAHQLWVDDRPEPPGRDRLVFVRMPDEAGASSLRGGADALS